MFPKPRVSQNASYVSEKRDLLTLSQAERVFSSGECTQMLQGFIKICSDRGGTFVTADGLKTELFRPLKE